MGESRLAPLPTAQQGNLLACSPYISSDRGIISAVVQAAFIHVAMMGTWYDFIGKCEVKVFFSF